MADRYAVPPNPATDALEERLLAERAEERERRRLTTVALIATVMIVVPMWVLGQWRDVMGQPLVVLHIACMAVAGGLLIPFAVLRYWLRGLAPHLTAKGGNGSAT